MPLLKIPPYFYPTQIVLIDDDLEFLSNMSLQLDADLAYLLFDSTQKALEYINNHRSNRPNESGVFGSTPLETNANGAPEIDPALILQKMYSPNRFSKISTVVVDYDMPGMDGLEFCRHIKEPAITKILLTGVATESLAVGAFNDGIIDHYIRKHEYAVYDRLNHALRKAQYDYMHPSLVSTSDKPPPAAPNLLADPSVASLLEALRRDHGIVEHYYDTGPPEGFLLINGQGDIKRVVVPTAHYLEKLGRRLAETQMPRKEINRVARAEAILNPDTARTIGACQNEQYSADTLPARPMPDGTSERKWALFDVVPGRDYLPVRPTYNEFLDWLDSAAYSLM
jgi:CheY-like chemotaxis protein